MEMKPEEFQARLFRLYQANSFKQIKLPIPKDLFRKIDKLTRKYAYQGKDKLPLDKVMGRKAIGLEALFVLGDFISKEMRLNLEWPYTTSGNYPRDNWVIVRGKRSRPNWPNSDEDRFWDESIPKYTNEFVITGWTEDWSKH